MAEYIVRGVPQSLQRDGWWLADSAEADRASWQHLAHQSAASNRFKTANSAEDHGKTARPD